MSGSGVSAIGFLEVIGMRSLSEYFAGKAIKHHLSKSYSDLKIGPVNFHTSRSGDCFHTDFQGMNRETGQKTEGTANYDDSYSFNSPKAFSTTIQPS
jgi:hypothetical protein